jgi:hypothetical protein
MISLDAPCHNVVEERLKVTSLIQVLGQCSSRKVVMNGKESQGSAIDAKDIVSVNVPELVCEVRDVVGIDACGRSASGAPCEVRSSLPYARPTAFALSIDRRALAAGESLCGENNLVFRSFRVGLVECSMIRERGCGIRISSD